MQKEEVGEIWGIGVGRQSTVVRTCKGSRPSVLHLTEFEPDNAVGRSHGSGGLGDKETCSKVESTSVLSEPKGKSCGPLQASFGFAGLGRNETQSGGLKWAVFNLGPHRNGCSVRPGPE
jgi:hypothetical protein